MSTTSDSSPVLVVGGGIAGLSTALALSRKGIPVQVIEQAAEFKEIGAGIQLGPNVFRMFEVLGLSEAVFRWAAFPEALEMRDSITGETVVEMRIDNLYQKYHDHTASFTVPTCSIKSTTLAAAPISSSSFLRARSYPSRTTAAA